MNSLKKYKKIILYISIILIILLFNIVKVNAATISLKPTDVSNLNNILSLAYMIMSTLCGLGLLAAVAAFAKSAVMLAKSGSGKERSEAYSNILNCTIYTACLASAPTLYTIFLAIFI